MPGTLAGDGRVVILAVLLASLAGLWGTVEVLGPGGVAVFFACGAPVLILLLAWWRLGDGVPLGFLASMYLHSTILSIVLSAFGELLMTPIWARSFPDCQLGFTAPHAISPRTERCGFLGFAAWLSIPGMIEETFKAVWFFYRLRRSPNDVPETCCGGMFFSQSNGDCGWWFKLAPTPQHVLLAAVAAGAGFEAVENLSYGLAAKEVDLALPVVIIRGFFPLHICWTGMIGVGLARRLFLPRKQSPSLFGMLWPVSRLSPVDPSTFCKFMLIVRLVLHMGPEAMLLHGMSDYSVILFETFVTAKDPGGCALVPLLSEMLLQVTSCLCVSPGSLCRD